MKPLNIFNTLSQDFTNLLDIQGEWVYVNKVPMRATITTPEFKTKYAEKYISTEKPLKRGDIIYYNNRYWMVMSQSDTKRYESYKANMRLIEYDVYFNLRQGMSEPPTNFLIKAPVIIEETSDLALAMASSVSMETITGKIHVYVQENALTMNIHKLIGRKGKIIFGQLAWDIISISSVQRGLLDVVCEVSTIGADDNMVDGVSGATHEEVLLYTDTSMYIEGTVPNPTDPTNPPEPIDMPTGTEQTSIVAKFWDKDSNGEIIYEHDPLQQTYSEAFAGYRIIVYKNSVFGGASKAFETEVMSDVVYIGDPAKYEGEMEWEITFETKFTDGENVVYLQPKTYTQSEITALPLPPLW